VGETASAKKARKQLSAEPGKEDSALSTQLGVLSSAVSGVYVPVTGLVDAAKVQKVVDSVNFFINKWNSDTITAKDSTIAVKNMQKVDAWFKSQLTKAQAHLPKLQQSKKVDKDEIRKAVNGIETVTQRIATWENVFATAKEAARARYPDLAELQS
jgi:hypothetical protein